MIEDFVKILALGYFGLEVEKKLGEKRKRQEKEWKEVLQKLKSIVFIVYDGKAPYDAAQNISKYIYASEPSYQIAVMDSEEFCREYLEPMKKLGKNFPRTIIVGHHEFAKRQTERVDLIYDSHGLKIGRKDGLYVLRACRSDLGYGRKGREAFAAYYDSEISKFDKEVLEKYGVPMTFGLRDETRKSQYDLLWLEFIPYLHGMFLSDKIEVVGTTPEGELRMRVRNPSHK
ncbi:hypothetical protein D1159_13395 [Pseudoflavonifractor sp. 524-17]|uniref:hypothetical protein n=1 Tax=Pseudoflavonifractor sp. 524-17 TaxID=2304577 RepID=UPI00137A6ABC|nr:hypothetical protein [Pseudoflavonifractor sp. 524-17]NCE65547.1 hypothetical protein [Pseudoflavonifractor sp. 524-17]